MYPEYRQTQTDVTPLREEDAYPAQPQDAYGWEKLITERLCLHYREEYGSKPASCASTISSAELGSWNGGREKAPAALCRKIATAKLSGHHEIEIWGDGQQTRSFCYVDDCVVGIYKLMCSEYRNPLNLGQDRMVTIDELADIISEIAGTASTKSTCLAHKACAAATPTTRCCVRPRAGNLRSLSKKASAVPTHGLKNRSAIRVGDTTRNIHHFRISHAN